MHPWSPADCVYLDSMSGYHFPAVMVRCKRAPATRAILHCHANACDVGHIYELCQRDAECWQANVLLVEYPGYGTSPGVSYERSVDRHVMCAYEYLVSDLGYKPESVVLFGRSLGSGPVCRLASRLQDEGERVGGVVLHSPFISVREVGISLLGQMANIISDRWDNRAPLSALRSKVLIIHGASDEVVPFRHAEVLRDVRKANGLPCVFHPTQGTHNYFSYYRDYLQPVENFLATLDGNRGPVATPKPLPPLPDPLPHAKFSRAGAGVDGAAQTGRRAGAGTRATCRNGGGERVVFGEGRRGSDARGLGRRRRGRRRRRITGWRVEAEPTIAEFDSRVGAGSGRRRGRRERRGVLRRGRPGEVEQEVRRRRGREADQGRHGGRHRRRSAMDGGGRRVGPTTSRAARRPSRSCRPVGRRSCRRRRAAGAPGRSDDGARSADGPRPRARRETLYDV